MNEPTGTKEFRTSKYFACVLPIMQANELVNTATGVCVQLSLYDKMVLCYILHYSKLYSKSGGTLFESQDNMAANLGMDRKTINRCVKKLCSTGAIIQTTTWGVYDNTRRKHSTYKTGGFDGNEDYLFREFVEVEQSDGKVTTQVLEYHLQGVHAPKQPKKKKVVEQPSAEEPVQKPTKQKPAEDPYEDCDEAPF